MKRGGYVKNNFCAVIAASQRSSVNGGINNRMSEAL